MLLTTRNCKLCEGTIIKPVKISFTQWRAKYRYCEECRDIKRKEKPALMRKARWKNHTPKSKKFIKMKTYKIAFVWQGISNEKIRDNWQDGLWYAINKLKKKHTIDFFEPWQDINGYDLILYWEAPVTAQGQDAPHYNKVRQNPTRKALLFAGGPLKKEWLTGFDLLFLESKINERECDELGVPWHHAFGINNKKFFHGKGNRTNKKYDAMLHGTCASWKRQWLIGEAFGKKGCVIGRGQDSDPYPFNRCRELGTDVFSPSGPDVIRELMRDSHALVNPADYWGGGQRATLEAMAVGLPVVCCNDSPKNMEFIEESGFGRIVEPTVQAIREGVQSIKDNPLDWKIGVKYIKEKWSGDIYAKQLQEGIDKILK